MREGAARLRALEAPSRSRVLLLSLKQPVERFLDDPWVHQGPQTNESDQSMAPGWRLLAPGVNKLLGRLTDALMGLDRP